MIKTFFCKNLVLCHFISFIKVVNVIPSKKQNKPKEKEVLKQSIFALDNNVQCKRRLLYYYVIWDLLNLSAPNFLIIQLTPTFQPLFEGGSNVLQLEILHVDANGGCRVIIRLERKSQIHCTSISNPPMTTNNQYELT